jgi:nitrogen regulatory protein P-II 1
VSGEAVTQHLHGAPVEFEIMKRIEAIIRPHKQEQVLRALGEVGSFGVTVMDVLGAGSDAPHSDLYQSVTQGKELVPRRLLVLYVRKAQVDDVLKAIATSAHTGKVGDGKIAVMPVDSLLKIRTGEEGEAAY